MGLVKIASEVESIQRLNLSKRTKDYFISQGISADELILAARRDPLGYAGYPSKMMKEVIEHLDAKGYIMRNFTKNIGYMNLLATVFSQDNLKIITRLEDFESNREYETYRPLDKYQTDALDEILDMVLRPDERYAIYSHYGIRGYEKRTPKEIAISRDWTEQRFYNTEARGITKLQKKHRRIMLIGILRYNEIGVRLCNYNG